MNKKIIFAAVLILLTAVSGCGRKKPPSTAETTSAPTPASSAEATPTAQTETDSSAAQSGGSKAESADNAVKEQPKVKISNADAAKAVQKAADSLMGEGALVIPSNDGAASEYEVGGKTRTCYMFGAAKLDFESEEATGSNIKNFYFDADSGEIFEILDNGVQKIN